MGTVFTGPEILRETGADQDERKTPLYHVALLNAGGRSNDPCDPDSLMIGHKKE
jgi:hypothetical protein